MSSNYENILKQKKLTLDFNNPDKIEELANALNSPTRIKLLTYLANKSYTVNELAQLLKISISTASFHIKLLKDAKLINVNHNSSKRGNEKIIALEKHTVELFFSKIENIEDSNKLFRCEIPIGSFINFDINGPCGMADSKGELIGPEGNPDIFYNYERINAEILWFISGSINYSIHNYEIKMREIESIEISMELCSECANYNNNYKSDIYFELNNNLIGTYTSLGDYGGRRGKYTPSSWPLESTQYGKLLEIRIDSKGCFFNHTLINNGKTINDFKNITCTNYIDFKIGVNKNAKYPGGINLFGANFGDYNQNIIFNIIYK